MGQKKIIKQLKECRRVRREKLPNGNFSRPAKGPVESPVWVSLEPSAEDVAYMKYETFLREKIAQAFGIPLHFLDSKVERKNTHG